MAPYCTLQLAVSGTASMVALEAARRAFFLQHPRGPSRTRNDQQLLAVVGNLRRVGEVRQFIPAPPPLAGRDADEHPTL